MKEETLRHIWLRRRGNENQKPKNRWGEIESKYCPLGSCQPDDDPSVAIVNIPDKTSLLTPLPQTPSHLLFLPSCRGIGRDIRAWLSCSYISGFGSTKQTIYCPGKIYLCSLTNVTVGRVYMSNHRGPTNPPGTHTLNSATPHKLPGFPWSMSVILSAGLILKAPILVQAHWHNKYERQAQFLKRATRSLN